MRPTQPPDKRAERPCAPGPLHGCTPRSSPAPASPTRALWVPPARKAVPVHSRPRARALRDSLRVGLSGPAWGVQRPCAGEDDEAQEAGPSWGTPAAAPRPRPGNPPCPRWPAGCGAGARGHPGPQGPASRSCTEPAAGPAGPGLPLRGRAGAGPHTGKASKDGHPRASAPRRGGARAGAARRGPRGSVLSTSAPHPRAAGRRLFTRPSSHDSARAPPVCLALLTTRGHRASQACCRPGQRVCSTQGRRPHLADRGCTAARHWRPGQGPWGRGVGGLGVCGVQGSGGLGSL